MNIRTLTAASAMLAAMALTAQTTQTPLPLYINDAESTSTEFKLQVYDYRNIGGFQVFGKENLNDNDWTLMTSAEIASGTFRDQLSSELDFANPVVWIDKTPGYKYFRAYAVAGDGGDPCTHNHPVEFDGGWWTLVDNTAYIYAEAFPNGKLKYPLSYLWADQLLPGDDPTVIVPVYWDNPNWKGEYPGPGDWVKVPSLDPTVPPPDTFVTWKNVDHTLKIDLLTWVVTKLPRDFDVASDATAKTTSLYFRYLNGGSFRIGTETEERESWIATNVLDQEIAQTRNLSGFYIAVFQLTNEQHARIVEDSLPVANPTHPKAEISFNYIYSGSDSDLVSVTQEPSGAKSVLAQLRAKVPGLSFDLPSEAQWEYACRAGTRGTFSDGDGFVNVQATAEANLSLLGWWNGNNTTDGEVAGTKVVGRKAGNRAGLYDMHGNVREWCRDIYLTPHANNMTTDFVYTTGNTGSSRIYRGGVFGGSAMYCRSACRNVNSPSFVSTGVGLRLAIPGPAVP